MLGCMVRIYWVDRGANQGFWFGAIIWWNWCFSELELTFGGLKNKIKKVVCVREARGGFFTIWASGSTCFGEGDENGKWSTEKWQSIGWAPTPKGDFTATEEVGFTCLWIHILVLPLIGLFWGLREIAYLKCLNEMCQASGIYWLSPGIEIWTLVASVSWYWSCQGKHNIFKHWMA